MAIVAGNAQTAFTNGAMSLAVTAPTGLVDGDVLVCWVGHRKAVSAGPAGWVRHADGTAARAAGIGSGLDYDADLWAKVITSASAEPATYTWTLKEWLDTHVGMSQERPTPRGASR
jgi:hypothetical protein